MRWRLIIPLIVFFPLLLIQITVIPLVSIDAIIPDLILIAVVYYSILYGQIYGTVLGSVFGILFDLITGSLLGSSMLSKTIAGFIAGYFSSETKRDQYLNSYSFTFVVFLCALVDTTIYSFFSAWDFNINLFRILFNYSLLPSIYTAIVSLIIVIIPYKRSFD
jgi:rod shape-determining protein MreD